MNPARNRPSHDIPLMILNDSCPSSCAVQDGKLSVFDPRSAQVIHHSRIIVLSNDVNNLANLDSSKNSSFQSSQDYCYLCAVVIIVAIIDTIMATGFELNSG